MKLLLTLLSAIILFGCAGPPKSFDNNKRGWRPTDFDPRVGTLMIEKVTWPKRQQRKMEEFMKKSYPYKYIFIDANEAVGGKYPDHSEYRFLLRNTQRSMGGGFGADGRSRPTATGFDFYFTDLLNYKTYPETGIASSWASLVFRKIIESCLKQ